MAISVRRVLGTTALAAAMAVTGMAGRPFIEAQHPTQLQMGDLAKLMATSAEAASVDYFLKLEGIDGESTDDRHAGSIEILSWSWGATQTGSGGSGGGGGAGKVSMQDFHFTADTSKASPELFLAAATGKHIKEATLAARKAGGKEQTEFLKVTLTDVLISSYQTGGSSGVLPADQVSLNFAKIEFAYRSQAADGQLGAPATACYDLKLNTRC